MRENRLYGSEGGGALTRSPYPYRPHPVPLRDDFVHRPVPGPERADSALDGAGQLNRVAP
jgi:hypothetical protein